MRQSRKVFPPGRKVRVLVVDDSVVVRRLIANAIGTDPQIELAGVAMDGQMGLEKMRLLQPDVITMDIEMPRMNGLEAVRAIRKENQEARILMFSTLSEHGAAITLEALAQGADDAVLKVVDANPRLAQQRLTEALLPRIKQFFYLEAPAGGSSRGGNGSSGQRGAASGSPAAATAVPATAGSATPGGTSASAVPNAGARRWPPGATATHAPLILAIGISTGGPRALETVLPMIPAGFPLPVVIVQHMPPLFTRMLAERLNTLCALEVKEAVAGEAVTAGKVLIAPGNFHMRVTGGAAAPRVALDQTPPVHSCRPAVDVLFQSLAECFGGGVLAAVLTGMGYDGTAGAAALKQKGATILAQDEATSVVWGMPGSVVSAGLADGVIPLGEMAGAFQQAVRRRPAAAPAAKQEEACRA